MVGDPPPTVATTTIASIDYQPTSCDAYVLSSIKRKIKSKTIR